MSERSSSISIQDTDNQLFGIEAIIDAINQIYPGQENHMQTNSLVKSWMGGPDPLDYISILNNNGDEAQNIPAHWHYISFGFSDLHGDGRVHKYKGPGEPSGYGFELTFRLKKEIDDDNSPPMWPPRLLNALAKYVFQTGSILNSNDHIPWHRPLDDSLDSAIKIQHMLIVEDPQMSTIKTPNGTVQFRQILGITEEEVKAAQHWNGFSILQLLARVPQAAGTLYVTNMQRKDSMFDMYPNLKDEVNRGIAMDGSNLGNITASFLWENPEIRDNDSSITNGTKIKLKMVTLNLHKDTAEMMPLIIKGRLMKGKYFIMQNVIDQVVLFIPPEFRDEMVAVSEENPIVSSGGELQILCCKSFQKQMEQTLKPLEYMKNISSSPPTVFQLHNPIVKVSVVSESELPSLVPK